LTALEIRCVGETDDEELGELCQQYWKRGIGGVFEHTIANLAATFNLRSSDVSKVVKRHCEAILLDYACDRCGGQFVVRTRSELAHFERSPGSTCDDCLEKAKEDELAAKRIRAEARRRDIAREFPIVDDPATIVLAPKLSLREAFSLAALLDDGSQEVDGKIKPVEQRPTDLAATHLFASSLIGDLNDAGLVRIHPDTAEDALGWNDNDTPNDDYFPLRATFYVSGSGPLQGRAATFLQSFEAAMPRANWAAALARRIR
jgi:hypothetical protein